MTTTSAFLNLTNGNEIRLDYTLTPPSGSALAFQLIDASGVALGPTTIIEQGREASLTGQPFTHIDTFSAAALSSGGFIVAFDENSHLPGSALQTEFLNIATYSASGQPQGVLQLTVASTSDPAEIFTGVSAFGLSAADRFAVFYDAANRNDGTHERHLGVFDLRSALDPQDRLDILLPSAALNHVSQTEADLLLGFANGDQVILAGAGHASVAGGAGDDTVIGGAPADMLRGGDGNDSILGGVGFDDINGNKGDDTIAGGGSGSDWLVGGQGNDLITGQGDFSILYGNIGADTLHGGAGGEWLRGGQGDDTIDGGAGNDFISGDRGNDTEIGGAGADTFNGFSGIGTDRILDFHLAEGDRIQLDPGTAWTATQVGADTVIDLGGGDKITLVGVDMTTLTPGWIFGF